MCIASLLPIHIGSGASSPAILRRTPCVLPPSNRLAFASVAPGAQAPPLYPAKLGFQPALLRCILHHPPQLSHREQLGTTLGVKRLLASTYHRLSRTTAVRFGCLPDTKHQDGAPQQGGAPQEPRRTCMRNAEGVSRSCSISWTTSIRCDSKDTSDAGNG